MNLFLRLSLVFLVTLLVLGVFSLWIAERSARSYFLEFTQRLNAPIAMYMAENADLVIDGELNKQSLSSLAEHVMMINPSVEVYVLDLEGRVMAQASSANVIAQPRVSMQPILEAMHPNSGSDLPEGSRIAELSNSLLSGFPSMVSSTMSNPAQRHSLKSQLARSSIDTGKCSRTCGACRFSGVFYFDPTASWIDAKGSSGQRL